MLRRASIIPAAPILIASHSNGDMKCAFRQQVPCSPGCAKEWAAIAASLLARRYQRNSLLVLGAPASGSIIRQRSTLAWRVAATSRAFARREGLEVSHGST